MNLEERYEFVDLIAQAVVDKMEERDRINSMVNMVVARIVEMQQAEKALKALENPQKSSEEQASMEKEISHVLQKES